MRNLRTYKIYIKHNCQQLIVFAQKMPFISSGLRRNRSFLNAFSSFCDETQCLGSAIGLGFARVFATMLQAIRQFGWYPLAW